MAAEIEKDSGTLAGLELQSAITVREFRRQFRRNKLYPLWGIPLALDIFVLGMVVFGADSGSPQLIAQINSVCATGYVLSIVTLLLVAFPFTASTIIQYERRNGRLDLLLLSRLTPIRIMRGFFLTLLMQCVPFLLLSLPIIPALALSGFPQITQVVRKMVLAAFLCPLLLAMGLAAQRRDRHSVSTMFIWLATFCALQLGLATPLQLNPFRSFVEQFSEREALRDILAMSIIVPVSIWLMLAQAAAKIFEEVEDLGAFAGKLLVALPCFGLGVALGGGQKTLTVFLISGVLLNVLSEVLFRAPPIDYPRNVHGARISTAICVAIVAGMAAILCGAGIIAPAALPDFLGLGLTAILLPFVILRLARVRANGHNYFLCQTALFAAAGAASNFLPDSLADFPLPFLVGRYLPCRTGIFDPGNQVCAALGGMLFPARMTAVCTLIGMAYFTLFGKARADAVG